MNYPTNLDTTSRNLDIKKVLAALADAGNAREFKRRQVFAEVLGRALWALAH